MDFLNKAMAQTAELFRSMTLGARITSGLLLALVVVSLAYLFRSNSYGPDVYLMDGKSFSQGEVSGMVGAFGDANLNGFEVDGGRIRVPRGQQAFYLAAAAKKGVLPPDALGYMDRAIDNGSLGIFSDRDQRKAQLHQAKQKLLSAIIERFPGVASATVVYDEEPKAGGLTKEMDKTAMVSVTMQGSGELEEDRAATIRRTVSQSISGMKYEKVTLVADGRQFSGSAEGPGGALDDLYREKRRGDEKELRTKILRALSWVPGANVEVNVELDKEQSRHERESKLDPKTVTLQSMEKNVTRKREGSGSGGPAGFKANSPAALQQAQGKGSNEDEDVTDKTEVSMASTTQRETTTIGMTPTRVTVSVGVPTHYFEQVWRERNPPAAGQEPKPPQAADLESIRTEEIAKIKTHVAKLLPAVEGTTDRAELVTVTPFQNITPPSIPGPEMKAQVIGWLAQYWTTVGLGGLTLVSLVMLRSMVRSGPSPEPQPVLPLHDSKPDEEANVDPKESARERRLKRLAAGGLSLRDELSELVTEDPDTAANILRTWIGNAS
ncbi:MAG: flagellar M-ring protein FliF C-terminal domain-containing protein [Thermoguttaceae bacterium]